MKVMANIVRPYGDTLDDGKVQLSFTLPLPAGPRAAEAARIMVIGWGFDECEIVHSASMDDAFTFFIAYARTGRGVDYDSVEADKSGDEPPMTMDEINTFIAEKFTMDWSAIE
jgi:beta-lysine 5,6-aminomutase beta subunit